MGAEDFYTCQNCGADISYDNIFFYYDEENQEIIDFLHLFSTAGIDKGSKIKGRLNITYCRHCEKILKIYIIEECEIENPIELVYECIFNHIGSNKQKIQKLKNIKKRKKFTVKKERSSYKFTFPEYDNLTYSVFSKYRIIATLKALIQFRSRFDNHISDLIEEYEYESNAVYLVLDEKNRTREDYDPLEKVCCPKCNNEVYKWINERTPCPKCGGKLLLTGRMLYD